MKILSIQGNFGNLNGKRIEFGEGFTTSVLPNGWGKTTLCAFLRVMLYGLNTTKRDTQEALADKTRFLPHDGKPMFGRLTVRHKGRVLVITRATGKGGPMQDFDAFYEDTGEKCVGLSAKSCGETLLGLGEDGFLSSVFIDGAQLMRPSDELRERMLDMAQTGDTQGRAADTLRTLERWRLDLDSGNGHGEIPRTEERLRQSRDALAQLSAAEGEIERQRALAKAATQEEDAARTAYERAWRAYAAEATGGEERLEALIAESQGMIQMLDARTPPEAKVRAGADALYGYEGALRLAREKRERLPGGRTRYEQAIEDLEEERRAYEIEANKAGEPRIRWIPLLLALLLAGASAATYLLGIDWGAYTTYAPLAMSGLAIAGLVAAFAGTNRRSALPVRDFEAERQELRRLYESEDEEQDTASSVLNDAYDALLRAAQAIDPAVSTIEDAERFVRQAQDDLQALRREEAALQELLMQRKRLPEGSDVRRDEVERLREALQAARSRADAARAALAQLEGRAQAIGDRAMIERECARFEAECAVLRQKRDAVCDALEEVRAAQAALSARVSPRITAQARDYMERLTGGAYSEVQLDAALHARCAGDDGRLLDALRLSSGTRDQLYFALRLAVSQVLGAGEEPAPLILDDPFITFDDERTTHALTLLRELAKTRQVILFSCRTLRGGQGG